MPTEVKTAPVRKSRVSRFVNPVAVMPMEDDPRTTCRLRPPCCNDGESRPVKKGPPIHERIGVDLVDLIDSTRLCLG